MTERENLEALVTAVDNLFFCDSQSSPEQQRLAKIRLASAASRARADHNLG